MVSSQADLAKTGGTRIFTQEGGPGPSNKPEYQGRAMASGFDWPQGELEPIRLPDPDQYNKFITVDVIQGQKGLPSLELEFLKEYSLSAMFALAERGCPFDLYIPFGKCGNPSDFDGGWLDGHVLVLTSGQATNIQMGEIGAMDGDQQAVIPETIPYTGLDAYQIGPLAAGSQAGSLVSDEIVDIIIADRVTCGTCGVPSDGTNVVLALQAESSGSPGIGPALFYSIDGGSNYTKSVITSAGLADVARKVAIVGTYVVVTVGGSSGYHIIPLKTLLDGLPGWTAVTTGLVLPSGAPNAIFSGGPTRTWIVGDGGYIYFSSDITAGVSVLDAGVATTEDLQALHGTGSGSTLLAAGTNGAIVISNNRGVTWTLLTGSGSDDYLAAAVFSDQVLWLGDDGGNLWYSRDGGVTWTAKAFAGSGSGAVRAISFSRGGVGYVAHNTAANVGRIFRSINGGYTWVQGPEKGILPTNRRINAIATSPVQPNVAYGGGLLDANDGIIVKLSA